MVLYARQTQVLHARQTPNLPGKHKFYMPGKHKFYMPRTQVLHAGNCRGPRHIAGFYGTKHTCIVSLYAYEIGCWWHIFSLNKGFFN